MKYKDLVQFNPIESVVQIQEADAESKATQLVNDYVISDSMASKLDSAVFSQLQFEKPSDNKGLLIVGNYGTGKSHLMAVISAVAEHAVLASKLSNPMAAKSAEAIAGRFKVVRAEINTDMPLRTFVCRTLSAHLAEMGVTYEFPKAEEVLNEKDALAEMMHEFDKVHPGQGLLLVIDELLDYLRSRKNQELILGLNYLRAIGEFCKGSRFRFIAGLQESLFDNPSFQFAADTLRRVKDRFEQVRIAREDVAFVVAERLLKKTPAAQAKIREHLTAFAPLYSSMNERMDDFVRLFPVHPAYLDVFERVYVAEKREILKTISAAIGKRIDQDLPADEPGLIAYDSYWEVLKGNPSFRAIPEIKEVIDKSKVVEDRVEHAFPTPRYRPVATRIVHALAIHRLTTGDIYAAIGATADELRDDLCLILPLPEKDVDFLKTLVEKILKEIVKTVSGQFISYRGENGQYYLDLKKDIDFDSLIEKRAESMDDDKLDQYYFDALLRLMEPKREPAVPGYQIWEHEIEWRDRKAGRLGYLFFGAPSERSTAQPPRDFYLYFLQPHEPSEFRDEKKPDEVFFRLAQTDDGFKRALALYAGARELAGTAAGSNKRIYEDKAVEHRSKVTKWLQDNALKAIKVTWQGRGRPLGEVLQGKVPGGGAALAFREMVNIAASDCLAPHFGELAPDYPSFSVLIMAESRDQAAQQALRWIGGSARTDQGTRVLDALGLLDGDRLAPRQSKYARPILDALAQKGQGQVLNRSELVQDVSGVEFWKDFRIEPELLAVVLAALAWSGDLVISVPGAKVDAASTDELTRIGIETLKTFKHVESPRDLPLAPLKELFGLLGLSEGLIVNPNTREAAVTELVKAALIHVERLAKADALLSGGITFWGQLVLSAEETEAWRRELQRTKTFLESLQAFNTVGKLKNFRHDVTAVQANRAGLDRVESVEGLVALVTDIEPLTSYLATAEAVLPRDHGWVASVADARSKMITRMLNPIERGLPGFRQELSRTLGDLKESYKTAYIALHNRRHLGPKDEGRKLDLLRDSRLIQLQRLAIIDILPASQLKNFQDGLDMLKAGYATPTDIDKTPVHPVTRYRPSDDTFANILAGEQLNRLEQMLDRILAEWTSALLSALQDPSAEDNIQLLAPDVRDEILEFIDEGMLPDPLTPAFIKAIQDVVSGLIPVRVSPDDLVDALGEGGPCNLDQLKERFAAYLDGLTKTKDRTKVRVVLEAPGA